MTQKPRIYDPEFKARAIELARTSGDGVKTTARNLGVGYSTLTKWIDTAKRSPSGTPMRAPGSTPHPLEQEVQRLRRENEVLRLLDPKTHLTGRVAGA